MRQSCFRSVTKVEKQSQSHAGMLDIELEQLKLMCIIGFISGAINMLYIPREEGQGLVEYALILVLVAIVVIVILSLLGPIIGNVFSNIVKNI